MEQTQEHFEIKQQPSTGYSGEGSLDDIKDTTATDNATSEETTATHTENTEEKTARQHKRKTKLRRKHPV